MKEIPNTNLLVSLHQNLKTSANIEIFDNPKEGKAKKIYSLGEVSGGKFIYFSFPIISPTFYPKTSLLTVSNKF